MWMSQSTEEHTKRRPPLEKCRLGVPGDQANANNVASVVLLACNLWVVLSESLSGAEGHNMVHSSCAVCSISS